MANPSSTDGSDWVICKCPKCRGIRVPLATKRQHKRILNHSEQVSEENVTAPSCNDSVSSNGKRVDFSTCDEDTSNDSYPDPPLDNDVFKMTFVTEALQCINDESNEDARTTQTDQAVFERLWIMDEAIQAHAKNIRDHIADMDKAIQGGDGENICMIKSVLLGDYYGLQEQLKELRAIDVLGDKPNEMLKTKIERSIEAALGKLGASGYSNVEKSFEVTDPDMKLVETDVYLGRHVHAMHPLILIPVLIVMSLNLFSHLSRQWCNATLRALRLYAKFVIHDAPTWKATTLEPPTSEPSMVNPDRSEDGNFTDLDSLLETFPLDLRTLSARFGMEAKIDVFAVCPDPDCCSIYAPVDQNGVKTYPRYCSKRHLRNRVLKECGALLCTEGVVKGESVRVPIRAFPVQDWDDFKARMVVDPLILTLLRRGTACSAKAEMRDIKDGTFLSRLKGADGNLFMDPKSNELRLAWSFSTDWFNPYLNLIAGKKGSVGSIAMTCLNLPPTFRYKPEYVFLAGIIPGPDEPKDHLVNNFLDVIVDQLERSFKHGTRYSTTYIYPDGIVERSIVAVFVFDLPAARKCCGMHSHSSKRNFCHLCRLRLPDINNLDLSSWGSRDYKTHMIDALAWKKEPVKTKKEKKFSKTGVRWSPFLRLPYFHPHRSVIVDGMHNLFLGVAMYHVREFLGINTKVDNEEGSDEEVNAQDLSAARAKLGNDTRIETIESFPLPILHSLCHEFEVVTDANFSDSEPTDLQRALLLKVQEAKTSDTLSSIDFTVGLVGEGFFEPDHPRVIGPITEQERKTIHSFIASTERPQWHKSPPKNLGEARHGKLKADQWRSLMEFDIPVALAQLWGESSERRQLFHCTMLLAIAIRFATSHVITEHHISQYKRYMMEYLKTLLEIDPQLKLRPNHHEALHLPDFLEFFGPIHGWWMFVYERMIGILQNTNSNVKIGGEMERTMMGSFCAAANFRAFLKRPDLSGIIHDFADAMELPQEVRGTLNQCSQNDSYDSVDVKKGERKSSALDDDVIEALEKASPKISKFIGQSWSAPSHAIRLKQILIGGKTFSVEKTTSSMGLICIHNGTQYVPGKLRDIISISYPDGANNGSLRNLYLFIVHQHLPASSTVSNPFLKYAEFGADLWSSKCYSRPSVVPYFPPTRICHGIFRKWDEKHAVVKALDREIIIPSKTHT